MGKDNTVLTQEVHDKFKRLAIAADDLNFASELLAKEISTIDGALRNLNLGIIAHVETSNPNIKLGHSRINRRWGLTILQVDTKEEWLFNDAPRPYRITACRYLHNLVEALTKVAEGTANRINKATKETREQLEGIDKENG